MLNAVAMPLPKQADRVPRSVDDYGEQASDVATEYAHVEGFRSCDGGVLPTQRDLTPAFGGQPNPGLDRNRINQTPDTGQALAS